MKLKVAISGSHGTGKSTLAAAVCEKLREESYNVAHLPELARSICEASKNPHFFRRGENSVIKQLLLIIAQIVSEEENIPLDGILICDRTVADHLSYTMSLFDAEINESEIENILSEKINKILETYDLVFYLSPELDPDDDGIRESDKDFQLEIAGHIRSALELSKIHFIEIRGSLEDRVNNVLKEIRKHIGNHE